MRGVSCHGDIPVPVLLWIFYILGKVEQNFLIPEIVTVDSNYQLTAFNFDFIWFQKEEKLKFSEV